MAAKTKKLFIVVGFDSMGDGYEVVGYGISKKEAVNDFRDSDGGAPLAVIEVTMPGKSSGVDKLPVTKVTVKE